MDPLPKTPSFRLDGRRAAISGGSRGIGLAIATAFAEAGATVHLIARTEAEVTAVAERLAAEGHHAHPLVLDVMDRAAVREAFAKLPLVDLLVNSAGTNRPKPVQDVVDDDLDAIIDLNVKATFVLSQLVAARLIAEGRPGGIINISSQMGHVGAANRSLYCGSKHAVEGFTKTMAVEFAPHGIRVNSLAPTFIETEMTRPFFQDETFRNAVLTKIKLGRLGTVEDVMGAALYLASDASALVTGTSLLVDGGWTAD